MVITEKDLLELGFEKTVYSNDKHYSLYINKHGWFIELRYYDYSEILNYISPDGRFFAREIEDISHLKQKVQQFKQAFEVE